MLGGQGEEGDGGHGGMAPRVEQGIDQGEIHKPGGEGA